MRRASHLRAVVALVVAVLVASACGSRLPDETLEAIDAGITGAPAAQRTGGELAAGPGEAADESTGAPSDAGPTAGPVEEGATATGAPAGAGGGTPGAAGTADVPCRPGPATGPGVSPQEIKVAAIVTDSGPLPGATEGSYRGAAAHFAMINSQGGVCGRKLTLLKGDDGLDPARARGEFLRLEPKILGFVGNFAVADSGYIDLIEKTNVPFVGLTIDPAGRKLPSVWPKLADDTVRSGPFVWWKQEHPDVTRAAILYADVGGVKANIGGVTAAIEKGGFKLVEPPIPVGVADPDYTGHVRNLQDKDVDFVYLFSFEVNMHVRFNRNMRQQRYDPPIKGSNIAFNDRFSKLLKTDGDGWENDIMYLPFLDETERGRSKAVDDFLTWNQRVFPGSQLDLFNVAGWGRAAMFVEALREAGGNIDRASLLKALEQVPTYNDGGVGVNVDPRTGGIDKCFAMAKHVGGTWKRLHPAGAGFECNLGEVFKFK